MESCAENTSSSSVEKPVSLSSLVTSCRTYGIPLVGDLSCFELRRDEDIYNPSLDLHRRAGAARAWESFGRSFDALREKHTNGVYFPQGTYEAVCNSRHHLACLIKSIQSRGRTQKVWRGHEKRVCDTQTGKSPFILVPSATLCHEKRVCDTQTEEAFSQLVHDAHMALRVWKDISRMVYKGCLPDAFQEDTRRSYGQVQQCIRPSLDGSLDRRGIVKETVRNLLEDIIAGTITLAAHSEQGAYAATRNPLVPVLFAGVYGSAERREIKLPRVIVSLFDGSPAPRPFFYPLHAPCLAYEQDTCNFAQ